MALPSWAAGVPNTGMQALQAALGNLSFDDLESDPLNAPTTVAAFRKALPLNAAKPMQPPLKTIAEVVTPVLTGPKPATADENQPERRFSLSKASLASQSAVDDRRPSLSISISTSTSHTATATDDDEADASRKKAPVATAVAAVLTGTEPATADENQPERRASFSKASLASLSAVDNRRPSLSISISTSTSRTAADDDDEVKLSRKRVESVATTVAITAPSTLEPSKELAVAPTKHVLVTVPDLPWDSKADHEAELWLNESCAEVVKRSYYTICRDEHGLAFDADYQKSSKTQPRNIDFCSENDQRAIQPDISVHDLESVREQFDAIPGVSVTRSENAKSLVLTVRCEQTKPEKSRDKRIDTCTCHIWARDECELYNRAKWIAAIIAWQPYFLELVLKDSDDITNYHLLKACTRSETLAKIKGRLWHVRLGSGSRYDSRTVFIMGDLLRAADRDGYNFQATYPIF